MYLEKGLERQIFEDLYKKIKNAWCLETCSPSLRGIWSEDLHPADGQCFVTALALQDALGGELYFLRLPGGAIHYYNMVDGKIADLSAEQFSFPLDEGFYKNGEPADRAALLKDSVKKQRYEELRKRLSR